MQTRDQHHVADEGVVAEGRGAVCPHRGLSRRSFLTRAAAVTLGSISARGLYELLDTFGGTDPQRALAATTSTRGREQYLIQSLEVILDNGVTLVVPPLHTDVITAKLAASRSWTKTTLTAAQSRLEKALSGVEQPYPATAAGLTIVVGWGLPYLRSYVANPWIKYAPVDVAYSSQTKTTQYAVLDAIPFPSDPGSVALEDNHVVFKFRSDSQSILQSVEHALFDDPTCISRPSMRIWPAGTTSPMTTAWLACSAPTSPPGPGCRDTPQRPGGCFHQVPAPERRRDGLCRPQRDLAAGDPPPDSRRR